MSMDYIRPPGTPLFKQGRSKDNPYLPITNKAWDRGHFGDHGPAGGAKNPARRGPGPRPMAPAKAGRTL